MVKAPGKKVAVVGGGISGLSAAWELMRGGCDVTVLESSSRTGGVIQTMKQGPYTFENGPTALRVTRREIPDFLQELGLADEVITTSQDVERRHLYYHGRLQTLPATLREFLKTDLLTIRQKLRVAIEPWVKRTPLDHEESVAEFFGRRLGRGITMTWIDIVVSGIFAGNPNRLGVTSAFSELKRMEVEHGSMFNAMRARARARAADSDLRPTMISFRQGLERLIEKLREKLVDHIRVDAEATAIKLGEDGRFGVHVRGPDGTQEVNGFDGVILATPAFTTGILLAPFASEAADLLFEVEYVNLVVAHAGFEEESLPGLPSSYGYLVPRCMRMRTLGWIFNSQVFPEQSPEGKISMTATFGGSLDPFCLDLSDDQMRHVLMGELALALGKTRSPKPEIFVPIRYKNVIPQLNVGHNRRIDAVKKIVGGRVPGLHMAGNWVDGPSIEQCIASGKTAARDFLGLNEEVQA